MARLGVQHRLWAGVAHEHWARAGFTSGQTILDVGAGPGFASRDLAQFVGSAGRVIAVDVSERFSHATRTWGEQPGASPIEARTADAARPLPIADDSVDGAYVRWVLHFVEDRAAVVEHVARVLKGGGVMAIQDYIHWQAMRWTPDEELCDAITATILRAYGSMGVDPRVGLRLPELLSGCGMRLEEARSVTPIIRPSQALWRWPTMFFRNFLPRVAEMGYATHEEVKGLLDRWDRVSADPDALFVSPVQVLMVARKDAG
jgi:ubiquinone/menaquinone biosynthesis C-methylase UbiE